MSHDSDTTTVGRRTFVAGLATAAGTGVFGGLAVGDAGGAAADRPAVEWRQRHRRDESVRQFQSVIQTSDGGYALAGTGTPPSDGETATEQFALLNAAADGTQQWAAYATDDTDTTDEISFSDLVETAAGDYVLVGYATNPPGDDGAGGKVAEAAKFTAGGEVDWVVRRDAFERDEDSDGSDAGFSDNALFLTALATTDGRVLAGGTFEGTAWLVSLETDGTVAWERQYEGFSVTELRARADGFDAVVDGDETAAGLRLDETGGVRERVALNLDYRATPHNQQFVCTSDGAYAYTGRDRDRENMVLGTLDSGGDPRWRAEYDGPSKATDLATELIETGDGGYALAGYMRVASDSAFAPAVVRTDASGTEQWRRLFTESDADTVADIVATADGGYACLFGSGTNTLVKLAPAGAQGSPPPSETPPATARDQPPQANASGKRPFGIEDDELGECDI